MKFEWILKRKEDLHDPIQQMARFNSVINSYGLQEVGFIGRKFTWLYQRSDGFQIRERLDRAL